MELHNQNGAHVQNRTAKEATKTPQNGEVKKEQANGKTEIAKSKTNLLKDEKPVGLQPGQVKQEEPKAEPVQVKEEITIVAALNLENRLKVVDDLHRKSTQRLNLIKRKNQLEAFEVALVQENDELEDNPYQGCKLIIRDDKNREFITTTPGLIRLVSQFIFNACHEKLAEIEASIVFPNS